MSNLGTFCKRNWNSSTISDLFHGVYTHNIWTFTAMARRFRGRSHKKLLLDHWSHACLTTYFKVCHRYTKYTPFRCLVTGSCVCAAKRTVKEARKKSDSTADCVHSSTSQTLAHILLLMNCHSLFWFLCRPFSVHEHPAQGLCFTGSKVWTP